MISLDSRLTPTYNGVKLSERGASKESIGADIKEILGRFVDEVRKTPSSQDMRLEALRLLLIGELDDLDEDEFDWLDTNG